MTTATVPHSWMPASPCGPDCLDREVPQVGQLRAAFRILGAMLVLAAAAFCAPVLFLLDSARRERYLRWVFVGTLRAFGARMVVHGGADMAGPPEERAGRGALVVINHISWLDIVAVNALQPMRSLAKKEIRNWPVLGRLVARAGTVFVDREGLSALPATVAELADALRAGSVVAVYAEGTTWCGRASGPFVPAPFQAALDGGVPVRPIALRYRIDGGSETTHPAFIGTDTLVASVRRVARLRGLVVEVYVCSEIAPGRAGDRRELAVLAEGAVRSALGETAVSGAARSRRRPARAANEAGPEMPALRTGACGM